MKTLKKSKIISGNKIVHLVFLVLFFYSCTNSSDWNKKDVGSLIWVNNNHEDFAIKNCIKNTIENSSIIIAQIPWKPYDSKFIEKVTWYHSLANDHKKKFMIAIDWQEYNRSGTREGWSFNDKEVGKLFKDDIIKLVNAFKPDYLNLGVEVNYFALTSPKGFKTFASIFRELKKEIKIIKPMLKVGLSYQLELLYGNHNGWNGTKTLKTLDNLLGDIDFLGVSTYPNIASEKNNGDILFSTKYIDSICTSYSIPIGISETGISNKLFNDFQRKKYIETIFFKAKKMGLKFIIWGSIIDAKEDNTWSDKIGLFQSNGIPKIDFNIWKGENIDFIK
jgi:hypothetical protein